MSKCPVFWSPLHQLWDLWRVLLSRYVVAVVLRCVALRCCLVLLCPLVSSCAVLCCLASCCFVIHFALYVYDHKWGLPKRLSNTFSWFYQKGLPALCSRMAATGFKRYSRFHIHSNEFCMLCVIAIAYNNSGRNWWNWMAPSTWVGVGGGMGVCGGASIFSLCAVSPTIYSLASDEGGLRT